MKMYDPYYKVDPTKSRTIEPQGGRSTDGRFTPKLLTNAMTDDDFPIDSAWWKRYAIGTRVRLDTTWGEDFRRMVIPDETIMSWRMICEMYEVARDAKLAGKTDDEAITSAHDYLAKKQDEAYAKLATDLTETIKDLSPADQSQAVDKWMTEHWDIIPEVKP